MELILSNSLAKLSLGNILRLVMDSRQVDCAAGVVQEVYIVIPGVQELCLQKDVNYLFHHSQFICTTINRKKV